ncbi:heavy metal-binding domain-containing protein [Oceanihabitans sediminis]|uniref:YbjQ family protein n=1 Tax=Oceanihabitans sediminis TaxID=1812012 RepID=A0A368P7I2_9FLAO|nr:heavy metal-binding domain-containing protein [Oceanihabitans sediminis]MDX1277370.1 heavy metal-binding domain-containing protein [Oceanihabitans sediminis]MDX1773020.1 heavy metal-binding domain-containing protein [Oceanihabitans sediminis]RBP34712.1 uncharacterized protein YbjQ (UPF0145 family) [Oceanihabitans sediminis]RCU58363.1 YbjQ family protein [Oceanihabitans sediminis]
MILTTTNSIEGFKIIDYLGIVTGVGVQLRKSSFSFKTSKYLDALNENINSIKEEAFQKLQENAKALKANAVVGIKVDLETQPTYGINIVSVTGTAVKVV